MRVVQAKHIEFLLLQYIEIRNQAILPMCPLSCISIISACVVRIHRCNFELEMIAAIRLFIQEKELSFVTIFSVYICFSWYGMRVLIQVFSKCIQMLSKISFCTPKTWEHAQQFLSSMFFRSLHFRLKETNAQFCQGSQAVLRPA